MTTRFYKMFAEVEDSSYNISDKIFPEDMLLQHVDANVVNAFRAYVIIKEAYIIIPQVASFTFTEERVKGIESYIQTVIEGKNNMIPLTDAAIVFFGEMKDSVWMFYHQNGKDSPYPAGRGHVAKLMKSDERLNAHSFAEIFFDDFTVGNKIIPLKVPEMSVYQ